MKISFNWFKRDKSKSFAFLEECLSKDEANKLSNLDYSIMTSADKMEERLAILSQNFGHDKAIWLNSRIEKDFILKYQKNGLMNWVDGKKDIEPKWRKEIIKNISEMEKPLREKELD
jgi:hypothetical protein